MKAYTTIAIVAAVLAGAVFAEPAEGGTINRRQSIQQHRIAHGVATGALTPRETVVLEARAASIAHQEAVMRRTGGGLSYRERAVLQHRLDNLSRAICYETRDRQRRR